MGGKEGGRMCLRSVVGEWDLRYVGVIVIDWVSGFVGKVSPGNLWKL